MSGLTAQVVAYGIMAAVLLLHAGLAYRLYHLRQEASALPFMGFLLARCGSGLVLVFNAILVQLIFPQFGAVQIILLSTLLDLPFHGLVPFCFIQFALAHLGRQLRWKLQLGYWMAFGGLILYYLVRNLWLLLHPEPRRVLIYSPITSPIGAGLIFLALGFWAFSLSRIPDPRRRTWSAILAATLTAAFLLQLSAGGRGIFRVEIRQTRAAAADASPTADARHPGVTLPAGAGWEKPLTALVFFWGVIPAYWVLRKYAGLPRPAAAADDAGRPGLVERYGLSPREAEVAALVMEGHSNKEIGDALFISLDTVKRHVTNVYRKTGAKNRVQLSRLLPPGGTTR